MSGLHCRVNSIDPALVELANRTISAFRAYLDDDLSIRLSRVGCHNNLMGYCAIISDLFKELALHHGYPVDYMCGSFSTSRHSNRANHCWNTYGNYIIDLSAKQLLFKQDLVVVDSPHAWYYPLSCDIDSSWGTQNPMHYEQELSDLHSYIQETYYE